MSSPATIVGNVGINEVADTERRNMSLKSRRLGAVIAATAVVVTAGVASPAFAAPPETADDLADAVRVNQVLNHLERFQRIADRNGDNRAAGLPGYKASVDYVVQQLDRAGYDPVVQEFDFDYFEENSTLSRLDPATTWVEGQDFLRAQFETGVPTGTGVGPIAPVDLVQPFPADGSSTSGCEDSDFAGFVAGSVALVQRGTCGFAVKVINAQEAGASAVIVTNDGRAGLVGMIGDATGLKIPAIFVASAVGEDLASTPGAQVSVTVDYVADVRKAYNVLAETGSGDDSEIVMAGAHLDSVQEGPGINDNGTGSAALLETAIQMKRIETNNKVRFAWWGAEESGLLGSEYYVANLAPEDEAAIALYLNFDMIGSPNYFNGIYDGDNSLETPNAVIPAGSAQIEDVFEAFFQFEGQYSQDTEFSGRSDYGPFIAVGIPAGGLFTGAEGVKTEEEAARYGGVAGQAYDPCYHQFCDNLTGEGQDEEIYDALRDAYGKDLRGNVNKFALDLHSDAMASVIFAFAFDTSDIPDRETVGARTFGGGLDLNTLRDRYTE